MVHGELGAAVSRQPDVLDDRRRRVDVHQHRVGLRVAHHVRRPHPHTHRVTVLSRDVQQELFTLNGKLNLMLLNSMSLDTLSS